VVFYLNNVTTYSNKFSNHLQHLKCIFERCIKYGILLNPKKNIFVFNEGKLLDHVISKYGILIDPKRTKSIVQIPSPHNKKSMQLFFGNINFVKRFVSDFREIIKPLKKMIKKDAQFKWGSTKKDTCKKVKFSIVTALALHSPNFENDFFLYTFSLDLSLTLVLTQKCEEGNALPIPREEEGVLSFWHPLVGYLFLFFDHRVSPI